MTKFFASAALALFLSLAACSEGDAVRAADTQAPPVVNSDLLASAYDPETSVIDGDVVDANNGAAAKVDAESKEAKQIIAQLAKAANLSDAYQIAERLEDLGAVALPALREALAGLEEMPRIAALRALYVLPGRLSDMDNAVKGLASIAGGKGTREVRLAATEVLSGIASTRHEKILIDALDQTFDVEVRIELAVALWESAKAKRAKIELKELLSSDSENYRLQAATALGRIGDLSDARDILVALSKEPTDRGRLAQAILERERAQRRLESAILGRDPADERLKVDESVLEQLSRKISTRFLNPERVTRESLNQAAAKGVLNGFDPYSSYLTEGQARRVHEVMQFSVPTLGLTLGAAPIQSARSNFKVPTVIAVQPGSAAEAAGVLPGDRIINAAPNLSHSRIAEWRAGAKAEVHETILRFLEMPLADVSDALAGEVGSSMGLLINRKGWPLSRWFLVEQSAPVANEFRHEILPGQIGYLRPGALASGTRAEMEKALAAYSEEKVKGILLDLRNTSGGSMESAIRTASLFLSRDTLIATSFGRNDAVAPKREYRSEGDVRNTNTPLVVIVNEGTADAAEVLTAALKEHLRARVVGYHTFGRALLQAQVPMEATVGRTMLLLTVGKYFTPVTGVPFNEKGISPDVEYEREVEKNWVFDELDELFRINEPGNYVNWLLENHRETALQLAIHDGHDSSKYPEWQARVANLRKPKQGEHLSDEHLRQVVRQTLRRKLMAEDSLKSFADLQSDTVFVAALKLLAKESDVRLEDYEAYRSISR